MLREGLAGSVPVTDIAGGGWSWDARGSGWGPVRLAQGSGVAGGSGHAVQVTDGARTAGLGRILAVHSDTWFQYERANSGNDEWNSLF